MNEFIEANMYILSQEVKKFLKKPKPKEDELSVESIYSGMSGVALLYNFYASKTNNKNKTREVCCAFLILKLCFILNDKHVYNLTYLNVFFSIHINLKSAQIIFIYNCQQIF